MTNTTLAWDRLYRTTEGYGRRYPFEPLVVLVQRLTARGFSGRRALDIGFGTIADLAMLHQAGYEIHGLEVSEAAISLAESALKSAEVPYRLDLWEPSTAFPADENGYDLAISIGAIHYNLDHHHVLREVHRVLRPGGRFMTTYHGPGFHYDKFTQVVRPGIRQYTADYPNESMRGVEFVCFDEAGELTDLYQTYFQDLEVSNYQYSLLGQVTSFWLVTGVAG